MGTLWAILETWRAGEQTDAEKAGNAVKQTVKTNIGQITEIGENENAECKTFRALDWSPTSTFRAERSSLATPTITDDPPA